MDKYEFNIKVEQIKKLVNKKDFATAMKIADTIDWRRVRNANLLSMISQVYEKNSEYQEAKEVLLLAFERAPIGKRLLYKLTELALREGSLGEAEDYYREFCDLAPEDTRQHLLRYMILREKDAPVDQLIHSLERYTNTELDEKWMYELAELYAKAGRSADCVQLCDKMILLFGIGTYVERATDLRQRYAPRTGYQANIPQNSYNSAGGYGGSAFSAGNTYGEGASGTESAYQGATYGAGADYDGNTFESGNGYGDGTYGAGSGYENDSFGQGTGYGGGTYGAGNGYENGSFNPGNSYGVGTAGVGNGYENGSFGPGTSYGAGAYGAGNGYENGSFGQGTGYGAGTAGAGNGYGNGSFGQGGYGAGAAGTGSGYENGSFDPGNDYGAGFYGTGNGYEADSYGAGNGYENGTAGIGNGYEAGSAEAGSGYGADASGAGNVYGGGSYRAGNGYEGSSYGAENAYGNGFGGAGNSRAGFRTGNSYGNNIINDSGSPYGNETAYGTDGFYNNMGNTNGNDADIQSGYEDETGYDTGYAYGNQMPYGDENSLGNRASSYGSDSSYGTDGSYEANSQPYKNYPASGGYIVDEELMANLHQAAAEKELAAEMSRISTEIYEEPEPVSNQTRVFHGKNNIRYLRPRVEEEKPYYSRTYTPHHMIIEAKTANEGFEMAVEALKKVHQETGITNQAIKITGSKLGQRGIINVSDKLAGKDLIVEEAGDLTQRDLEELQMLLERDETGMIVVLIDNPLQIEELHQQNPGFINLFKCIGSGENIKEPVQEAESEEAQNNEICQEQEADLPETGQEAEEELSAEEPEEDLSEEPETEPEKETEPEEETKEQPAEPEREDSVLQEEPDTEEAEEDIADADEEPEDDWEPEEADEEFYGQEDYDEDDPLDEEDLLNEEERDDESDIESGSEEEVYEDEYEEFDEGIPADDDEELEIEEFADYAVQYANEIDCSITGKSMLALYERVETMEENGIPLTRANAEDMIEEAADRAEKPSIGGLIKGVFSSKYDKEGLLILKEEHFL